MANSLKIAAYGNYDVLVEQNLNAFSAYLKTTKYSQYFVLIDENTALHCLPILKDAIEGITLNIIEIKSGEQNKNFETLQQIIQQLIANQADRNALLINLGGGVICDMGAFAASIYKRGIHFVQIPTTLLAMVDASVGGKTGINFDSYKNQVGTFTNPKLVYANTEFLNTLPERHKNNGFAEMLKHGYLSGQILSFNDFVNFVLMDEDPSTLIFNSVKFKNEIVTKDFDEKAERKQLNFGHTVGHAIESYSLKKDGESALLHGEAIATGFVVESILSQILFGRENEFLAQVRADALAISNPYKITPDKVDALIKLMMNDKKNDSGTIRFALLKNFGEPVWDVPVTEIEIKKALDYYSKLNANAV